MRRGILVALAVVLVPLLVLTSCADGISQEQYDSAVAERDTAQAQITQLEDDIADLESQLEAVTTARDAARDQIADLQTQIDNLSVSTPTPSAEEAWDRAQQRHHTIMQEIPFLDELETIAPWIRFPDKPDWLDSTELCSAILSDDPTAYDAVCIVTTDTQQMLVRLVDYGTMTTMICQGGSVDYEITVSRDPDGKIIQEMMRAGDSWITLDWIDTGIEEILMADVNGILFEAPWSEDPAQALVMFSDLAAWLDTTGMSGGLIKAQDQPLVIIALGELRQPPFAALSIDWIEVLQRAVSDFMEGVPQTCM
ncbi:MAG: hypothetical protein JSW16_04810 [Dehalococcoidales bacterium]|nr:MAG: hypothetical protein JSW16_04810 [Dehalococcoidales bacterium]